MKTITISVAVLSLLLVPAFALAQPAPAAPSADDGGTCHWVRVCRPKKKKNIQPPPGPIAVPEPLIIYRDRECPPPIIQRVEVPGPAVVVDRPVLVTVVKRPECHEWKRLVLGAYGELGMGVRPPFTSGELGVQLEVPKAFLGLRAFSELQYGVGFQGLVYVYRGSRVKVHVIDPGVLITGSPFRLESDPDIRRRVDLLVGAGVQVKLVCHLELLIDWRANVPDPRVLHDDSHHPDCSACGTPGGEIKTLSVRGALGNAFAESQLKAGLLVRF